MLTMMSVGWKTPEGFLFVSQQRGETERDTEKKEMKGELSEIERKHSKDKNTKEEWWISVVLYWWLLSPCISWLNCGDLERFLNK